MLSEIYNVQYCLNCGFCFVMKFCCGTCICTYCNPGVSRYTIWETLHWRLPDH